MTSDTVRVLFIATPFDLTRGCRVQPVFAPRTKLTRRLERGWITASPLAERQFLRNE
jgi:hypothetical protein